MKNQAGYGLWPTIIAGNYCNMKQLIPHLLDSSVTQNRIFHRTPVTCPRYCHSCHSRLNDQLLLAGYHKQYSITSLVSLSTRYCIHSSSILLEVSLNLVALATNLRPTQMLIYQMSSALVRRLAHPLESSHPYLPYDTTFHQALNDKWLPLIAPLFSYMSSHYGVMTGDHLTKSEGQN